MPDDELPLVAEFLLVAADVCRHHGFVGCIRAAQRALRLSNAASLVALKYAEAVGALADRLTRDERADRLLEAAAQHMEATYA